MPKKGREGAGMEGGSFYMPSPRMLKFLLLKSYHRTKGSDFHCARPRRISTIIIINYVVAFIARSWQVLLLVEGGGLCLGWNYTHNYYVRTNNQMCCLNMRKQDLFFADKLNFLR